MCRSRRSSRMASMRIISPSASSSYRSGWNSRSVPSNERANARATSRLPTPGGPWKRYACAGPSRNAASSMRPASACSEKRTNVLTDLLSDLLGGPLPVERDDAFGVRRSERPKRLVGSLHELRGLALDAVAVPAATATGLSGIDQDEERPIGEQAPRD